MLLPYVATEDTPANGDLLDSCTMDPRISLMPPNPPHRQHLWWDSLPESLAQPASGIEPVALAIDRLSLAFTAQHTAGGPGPVAQLIAHWCQQLSCNRSSLITSESVRDAMDRLDREHCEPQSWNHLTAAEIALREHIRLLRQPPASA